VNRVWGTAYAHPQYSNFTDLNNWNDVGVVILDKPSKSAAPAKLAPLNYLDGYAAPVPNSTLFDLVGYGTEVRKPDSGPQKAPTVELPADPPVHQRARAEADAADPAAQRQPE
jgi:hypothetical protein